jgi:clan AA aspartic protease
MGLTYADITLANGNDYYLSKTGQLPKEDVKQVTVKALVDSGAYMLVINQRIKNQLNLAVYENRDTKLADGSIAKCEIVGPVDVFFKNRATTCRAVVVPREDEVLLGAIPMEDLDVIIDMKNNELIVHPDRPYMQGTIVK